MKISRFFVKKYCSRAAIQKPHEIQHLRDHSDFKWIEEQINHTNPDGSIKIDSLKSKRRLQEPLELFGDEGKEYDKDGG